MGIPKTLSQLCPSAAFGFPEPEGGSVMSVACGVILLNFSDALLN